MTPDPADFGSPQRALKQRLRDWQRAGLTHLPRVEVPAVVLEEPLAEPAEQLAGDMPGADASASPKVSLISSTPTTTSPMSRDEREQRLTALTEQVARCTRCQELAETRTQTVFGVGNPEADVMFIGEAPGADEDRVGEPFVGRAGQLLTKIIEACGWTREQIYICNILRCRPPGNRNPTGEEASNCREYLDGQINTIQPKYIVCWGSVAAKNLLDTEQAIGKMRQRWFQYANAKVLCTYHPSYLLRNPSAKKPVWEDMKFLLDEMGLTPPSS